VRSETCGAKDLNQVAAERNEADSVVHNPAAPIRFVRVAIYETAAGLV
jgi:hypothetical protein